MEFSALYLSPFLKTGVMCAVLQPAGTINVFRDTWYVTLSEGPFYLVHDCKQASGFFASSLKTLGLFPSGPLALERSRFWRSLTTPGVVMLTSQ